jgi:hypothetical protein
MAKIWYLATSFIKVPHIMGSVVGPIRFLLPACRFRRFLYTFNIHLYMHIFRRIFLSNYWWQESDIWSKLYIGTPYHGKRMTCCGKSFWIRQIPTSCLPNLLILYAHWTYILYMPIFRRIFLSNYWWQKSDIWSHTSYRYPISWEAFFDPSDSYFLLAEEQGYLVLIRMYVNVHRSRYHDLNIYTLIKSR